ncbi:MAG: hypothetical protein K0R75_2204 [Paenibacillaceae bacterium]|jgi:hypothetical protein|nr:hypothetical protein [Paenibacillaceae bacterium]
MTEYWQYHVKTTTSSGIRPKMALDHAIAQTRVALRPDMALFAADAANHKQ